MATRPFREVFYDCLLLDGDLDLKEDLCVLGDLDLQDPIPPCDVLERLRLECDLGPAEVLFFFLTSESDFPEL